MRHDWELKIANRELKTADSVFGRIQLWLGEMSLRQVTGARMKTKSSTPEIVLRKGKPAAVILDIEECREMLERLEETVRPATIRR